MAIPCKEPEGFGGASFHLSVDAVQKFTPAVGQNLNMVHAPLKISKHEDVDTNELWQYSIGIVQMVIEGTHDTTYVYVYAVDKSLLGMVHGTFPMYQSKEGFIYYVSWRPRSVSKLIRFCQKVHQHDLF